MVGMSRVIDAESNKKLFTSDIIFQVDIVLKKINIYKRNANDETIPMSKHR